MSAPFSFYLCVFFFVSHVHQLIFVFIIYNSGISYVCLWPVSSTANLCLFVTLLICVCMAGELGVLFSSVLSLQLCKISSFYVCF